VPSHPAILWAEDNTQDRLLIRESVEVPGSGQGLKLVADGVLLLESLALARPDLVVLDLKMPRLGGLEALRRIRNRPDWQDLRVVVFSSGNRPEEIEQCAILGVDAYVQKPVDFDAFSDAVQRIVRSARPDMFGGMPQSSAPVSDGVP
jgi:CheY-like chemotaxis protein